MKFKTFFYQNDQRKKLYKVWYEREFLEYPFYSFMRKNKNVHAFFGPHCMAFTTLKMFLYETTSTTSTNKGFKRNLWNH